MVKAVDFDSVIAGSIPATPAQTEVAKLNILLLIFFGDTSVYIGK